MNCNLEDAFQTRAGCDALARTGDPDTSFDAAESVEEKAAALEALLLAYLRSPAGGAGLTTDEAKEYLESIGKHCRRGAVAPRLSSLLRKGLARAAGKRKGGAKRMQQVVYAVSEAEQAAVAQEYANNIKQANERAVMMSDAVVALQAHIKKLEARIAELETK